MNRNSRSIRLIEASLEQLESGEASAAAADALLALDELRRLERKWNEQFEAGSTRRIASDFTTLRGWYRRWLVASKPIAERNGEEATRKLREARAAVEKALSDEPPPSIDR